MVEFQKVKLSFFLLALTRVGFYLRDRSWGDIMKHVLKASFLMVLGAVLLAALHSHLIEHQVPHPRAAKTAKVSLAKHIVPQPQLPVAPAVVVVLEHLIAIGFIAAPGAVALVETERSSCCLRGPPLVRPLDVR